MFTINHNTSDYAIEHTNNPELKDVLVANGHNRIELRSMKTPEVVALAKTLRDRFKIAEESRQNEIENARKLQIEVEKMAGKYARGCKSIAEGFKDLYNSKLKVMQEFQSKIAAANCETNEICTQLEWYADDVFAAYSLMDFTARWNRFFVKQTEEPTYTIEELRQHISEVADDQLASFLSVSTSQSTNPVANVRTFENHKADGCELKSLRALVKYFDKIFIEGKEGYGHYIAR